MSDELYGDREQSRAKHDLLRKYLEPFAFKILQNYGSLDFIDGFAGPWENKDTENFSDTSFGIAISTLAKIQSDLTARGRIVSVRCIFNEAKVKAYKKLDRFVNDAKLIYPSLDIHALKGEFAANSDQIDALAGNRFRLVFVDPRGWIGYPRDAMTKLLVGRDAEVMINFMSSFIDRFFRNPEDQEIRWLADMLGAERAESFRASQTRESDIRDALCSMLIQELRFRYVCESPIVMENADKIHFWMLYGTRSPHGVEVLREAEFKALGEHEKRRDEKQSPGQGSFFDLPPAGPYSIMRERHLNELDKILASKVQNLISDQRFLEFAAEVMSDFYVRKTEVKDSIVRLSSQGLVAPTWKARGPRAKKPDDDDRIRFAKS